MVFYRLSTTQSKHTKPKTNVYPRTHSLSRSLPKTQQRTGGLRPDLLAVRRPPAPAVQVPRLHLRRRGGDGAADRRRRRRAHLQEHRRSGLVLRRPRGRHRRGACARAGEPARRLRTRARGLHRLGRRGVGRHRVGGPREGKGGQCLRGVREGRAEGAGERRRRKLVGGGREVGVVEAARVDVRVGKPCRNGRETGRLVRLTRHGARGRLAGRGHIIVTVLLGVLGLVVRRARDLDDLYFLVLVAALTLSLSAHDILRANAARAVRAGPRLEGLHFLDKLLDVRHGLHQDVELEFLLPSPFFDRLDDHMGRVRSSPRHFCLADEIAERSEGLVDLRAPRLLDARVVELALRLACGSRQGTRFAASAFRRGGRRDGIVVVLVLGRVVVCGGGSAPGLLGEQLGAQLLLRRGGGGGRGVCVGAGSLGAARRVATGCVGGGAVFVGGHGGAVGRRSPSRCAGGRW